jgi:tetratricopeptide (TPR) repeat protein
MAKQIKQREDNFDLLSQRRSPLQKFYMALGEEYRVLDKKKEMTDRRGRGLALRALQSLREVLEDSAKLNQLSAEEKSEVAHRLVHLSLYLGLWQDAKQLLSTLDKSREFPTMQAMLAAALGDYHLLEKSVVEMEKQIPLEPVRQVFAMRLASLPAGLALNSTPPLQMDWFRVMRNIAVQAQENYLLVLTKVAELRTLRGILALEKGDTADAKRFFQQALDLAGPGLYFPDRAIAERYSDYLKKK